MSSGIFNKYSKMCVISWFWAETLNIKYKSAMRGADAEKIRKSSIQAACRFGRFMQKVRYPMLSSCVCVAACPKISVTVSVSVYVPALSLLVV